MSRMTCSLSFGAGILVLAFVAGYNFLSFACNYISQVSQVGSNHGEFVSQFKFSGGEQFLISRNAGAEVSDELEDTDSVNFFIDCHLHLLMVHSHPLHDRFRIT